MPWKGRKCMIKIACVGDNVVDINYIDGIVNPGGNCVNVAVYCSQMGHKAAYVGVLADDDYAKVITDSLKKNQVAYDMSPVGHGETGRCFINLVDGDRIIGDENDGGLLKASPLRLDEKLIMYLKKFDIVHTSCYSYIDDELEKIKDAGIPLLYDFSIEWDDEKISRLSEVADFAESFCIHDSLNNKVLFHFGFCILLAVFLIIFFRHSLSLKEIRHFHTCFFDIIFIEFFV